jgi:transcriptional regulator with XRE-family HTH domain
MPSKARTLGDFIAEEMDKHQFTNRSLAAAAGISEGAVRNVLKYGNDKRAKDPDARTILAIADALSVEPLRLYRLAGYVPPQSDSYSARAEYLAETFDELPPEKQDAVMSVLEAMTDKSTRKTTVKMMRDDSDNPLAGFDLVNPIISQVIANQLIAQFQMTQPSEVELIKDDTQVLQYRWRDLPYNSQQRIKALIRHKLSLKYDPTMVDPNERT